MRFYHLVLFTLFRISLATSPTPTESPGIPCTEMLSSQADILLSATTPEVLAAQLVPTTIQNQIINALSNILANLPSCHPSQKLHASLIPEPHVSIFFPTDTPTAIPSLFSTTLSDVCKIHEHQGLYKVIGIDHSGPGATFLTFRGARMVAFDIANDAIVKIEVKVLCGDEEVANVRFGEFTVAGLRDVLGRGFMVGRVGTA